MDERILNSKTILIGNIEYQVENVRPMEIAPRMEEMFTAEELSCGSNVVNGIKIMNCIGKDQGINISEKCEMALNISTSARDVQPVIIGDSDDSVIFVEEHINDLFVQCVSNTTKCLLTSARTISLTSDTSSNSSNSSPQSTEPRRNPRRNVRNVDYKKKCSEYLNEEEIDKLMLVDDDSIKVEKVDKVSPSKKGTRPKKVVVNNWPAEGLHERPEYNEQTEEIEKFDYSIRQIENCGKKGAKAKTKTFKAPKKKYTPKKYGIVTKKHSSVKSKGNESTPIEELKGVIDESLKLLAGTFIETVNQSRRIGLHLCEVPKNNEDKENRPAQTAEKHKECANKYKALLRNQSELYCLTHEGANFNELYKKLKDQLR